MEVVIMILAAVVMMSVAVCLQSLKMALVALIAAFLTLAYVIACGVEAEGIRRERLKELERL